MPKSDPSPTGLEYLIAPTAPAGPVVAVVGDDGFLKHEVLAAIRRTLCGSGNGDLDWHAFEGPTAEWRDVIDAVGQLSLFGGGGKQVALIEEADAFVTRYREKLEHFAAGKSPGAIVLDVKTLPSNTRLAKAVAEHGLLVACKAPERGPEVSKHRRDAAKWLTARAESVHRAKLTADAIDVLFDLLPMSLGVIDQEVARLALLAGEGGRIDATLAREHVGGWRTRTAWDLVDAAADGRAGDALGQLDRLLTAGEQPIGVLAQLGSTLRKFATAALAVEQGERSGRRVGLPEALKGAGFPPFKLDDAQRQLRQIGRQRALSLNEWVLEADLAMKGHNSAPARARTELERLLLRLSREAV